MRNGKIFSWEAEKENKIQFDVWPLATVNESIQFMRYHCLIMYITIG